MCHCIGLSPRFFFSKEPYMRRIVRDKRPLAAFREPCESIIQPILVCCNTLQHTTTHCNTHTHLLQRMRLRLLLRFPLSGRCSTPQHTATPCTTVQHAATHCNMLQHTATHIPVCCSGCGCFCCCSFHSRISASVYSRCAVSVHCTPACCGKVFDKLSSVPADICCLSPQHTTIHCNTLPHTETHRHTRLSFVPADNSHLSAISKSPAVAPVGFSGSRCCNCCSCCCSFHSRISASVYCGSVGCCCNCCSFHSRVSASVYCGGGCCCCCGGAWSCYLLGCSCVYGCEWLCMGVYGCV